MQNSKPMTEARRQRLLAVAQARQAGLLLVMEDVHNPHNLAAIARTCDSFGVQQIAAVFETHTPFDPRTVGELTSASARKWLDYSIHEGTEQSLQALKDGGWSLLATVTEPDAPSIYEADLTHPQLALMLGNERAGLSPAALAMADAQVHIPMRGMVRSLNVSVTAAILLFEITRQRQASGRNYQLDAEAAAALAQSLSER